MPDAEPKAEMNVWTIGHSNQTQAGLSGANRAA